MSPAQTDKSENIFHNEMVNMDKMNDKDEDIFVPVLGVTKTLGSSLLGPNARSLYEDQLDQKMISEIIADYSELLQTLRMSLDGDRNVIFRSRIYSLEYILWRAEQGNYSSLRVVAGLLFFEDNFPYRRPEGIAIFTRLAQANYYLAKYDLFRCYQSVNLGKEHQYIIEELIASNYPPAMNLKAYQLAEGDYSEPDTQKAKKYWLKAAALNNIPAQRKLMKMKLSSKNILDKVFGFLGLIPSTISCFYFGARGIEDDRVA